MIHIADLRKNRLFDPTSTRFQGVLPPSGQQVIAASGRGQPLSGTREKSMARFVAAFAIPHPRSAICHLRSAICHLRSAICHLRSAICHLRSAICHLPFLLPHPRSEFRIPHFLESGTGYPISGTKETLIVVSSDLSHQFPCADKPSSLSQLAARRRQM